jgi:hypothetical protein
MKLFSKAVAAAVLLVLLGVPAMACLMPNAQLTEQEKSCCRKMANECGSMGMHGDHSCCQKTRQQDAAVVTDATHFMFSQSSVQVADVDLLLSSALSVEHTSAPERLRHPPPKFSSPFVEILRI